MKKTSGDSREVSNRGQEFIVIKGARTHNLKNIDLKLPRNQMIAITGLSGSGKSSLAFDTIFAEGQRRYVESLSAYARQFLSQMPKPDVDEISGLSPAISIDQKSRSNNPRSTVATITEIYDYLRVLYARIGRPYSPISGRKIERMTNDEIVEFVQKKIAEVSSQTEGKGRTVMGVTWNEYRIQLFAPVVRGRKGEYYQMLYDYLSKGYSHVRIDGVLYDLREKINLSKTKPHTIELLIDELALHEATDDTHFRARVAESVERGLAESDGLIVVAVGHASAFDVKAPRMDEPLEYLFSTALMCPEDGFSFPEIEPRLFSFNSPYGACPECKGLGVKQLFGNEHDEVCKVCFGSRLRPESSFVFLGTASQSEKFAPLLAESRTSIPKEYRTEEKQVAPLISKKLKAQKSDWIAPGFNIFEFVQLPINVAHDVIMSLELTQKEEEIAGVLLNEIEARLQFLLDVGLEYLSLNRRANTLSGGEAQRIRLASQLGSKLVGALYVLDEPTIGLHQRDNDRLIQTLLQLRDLGNTIILVEHDEDAVRAADYIVDIGPGAGVHGGNVMVSDYLQPLLSAKKLTSESITLEYLRHDKIVAYPETRRMKDKGAIKIVGAKLHNIDNLNITLPLGRMVGITGVSGSGKSTFMYEILYKNLLARYDREYRTARVFNCSSFEGDKSISRVVMVDQSPIGRTPRSNPATYTGAWGPIRDLFAATTESQLRGWGPGRFSFNVKGGRCEACEGRGQVAVEMHFLPTVYVKCDVCMGKRFDKETLSVTYNKKNVYEVLEMTVEEAELFFREIGPVHDRLQALISVGLGYLKLGQPASELSGGESQRVKIASELYRPMTERTVYLLDEPTVGLHFADVDRLIGILQKLVDRGNSVILIEHNLDVVKCCDYLFDFGPEGGSGGGKVIAEGTPESIANNPKSHTGHYLKKVL